MSVWQQYSHLVMVYTQEHNKGARGAQWCGCRIIMGTLN